MIKRSCFFSQIWSRVMFWQFAKFWRHYIRSSESMFHIEADCLGRPSFSSPLTATGYPSMSKWRTWVLWTWRHLLVLSDNRYSYNIVVYSVKWNVSRWFRCFSYFVDVELLWVLCADYKLFPVSGFGERMASLGHMTGGPFLIWINVNPSMDYMPSKVWAPILKLSPFKFWNG